jgi:aspartyl-tRNA(Asn)/glutamyl-tRNA(Gln) amidotransferase subunit A
MHGIPIGLKDLYDTKGVRTTAQSKVFQHRVPARDATVVARLRQAGAILLGKHAMGEFASGSSRTKLFHSPRNPWDTRCYTGGSSSGSAAAVSAGLCAAAMGSDTGGSIRGPSAYCGIVGLKPTYGRVSRHGVVPLSWSLDHCGPMTRTVEDAAIVLSAVAGHDPLDPTSSPAPVPDYLESMKKDVTGLVLGIPRSYIEDSRTGVSSEVLAAFDKALKDLETLGIKTRKIKIPSLEYAKIAQSVIMITEGLAYHRNLLKSQRDDYGTSLLGHLYSASFFSGAEYVKAQQVRAKVTHDFLEILRGVDLIALPTTPHTAPLMKDPADPEPMATLDGRSLRSHFDLNGLPAISVPCGFDSGNLPIGLQLAGRPFDESTIFSAAYAYQEAPGWHKRHPPI